jgi:hypothetical protein
MCVSKATGSIVSSFEYKSRALLFHLGYTTVTVPACPHASDKERCAEARAAHKRIYSVLQAPNLFSSSFSLEF